MSQYVVSLLCLHQQERDKLHRYTEILRHVLQHQVSGDMFCEQVRWIVGAGDLIQSEVAALQPVLNPQVADMQVAYFAEPTSATNSYRCRSIGS